MNTPLIPILFIYISGIISGRYYFNHNIFLLFALSALIISAAIFIYWKTGASIKKTFILLLFYIIGYLIISLPHVLIPSNHLIKNFPEKRISLKGKVYRANDVFRNKIRIYLDTESVFSKGEERDVSGKARITIYDLSAKNIGIGDTLIINSLKLKIPENFKNPGMFDYKGYLINKGIYVVGSIHKADKIIIIEKGSELNLFRLIDNIRNKMISFFENNSPYPEVSVLKAVILGDKGGLSKKIKDRFNNAGVSHLLAISGLHVGFIAAAFFYIVKKIISCLSLKSFMSGSYLKLSASLTIVPIVLYTILVGASISSVRASIMIIAYLLSIILGREDNIVNTAAAAAFLILIYNPLSLFSIGFQLSFTAVFSIIFTYKRIKQYRNNTEDTVINKSRYDAFKKKLSIYVLTSVSAYISTAPLVLFYFHRISFYSIFANILIIPLAGILIPAALTTCIISLLNVPLAAFILQIPVLLASFILKIIDIFLYLPGSSILLPSPSVFILFLYYLVFICLFYNKKFSKRLAAVTALFLLLFVFSQKISIFQAGDNILEVTFIDVGQGESSFVKFPDGKTMLIDGGSFRENFDIGEMVVIPYLFSLKVKRLNYIIATHTDNDHIGGLFSIMKQLKVKNFFDNGYPREDKTSLALRRLAGKKGIRFTNAVYKDSISIAPNINIEFLHPSRYFWSKVKKRHRAEPSDNNLSVVTKITYKDISFLFTGDIEKEAEYYLLEHSDKLKSTILKVSHHGSFTSTTKKFLKSVKPEIAVISLSSSNPFGHPHKSVINRLKKLGVDIYRTDQDGAVTVRTDGTTYWVKTFSGR